MPEQLTWLALGYSIPMNPSRNRVYVWRKLKEFGAEYFRQGVALLPNRKNALAQFTALAEKIRSFGGTASLMEMRFVDPADERMLVERFRSQSTDDFTSLLMDCTRMLEAITSRRDLADFEHSDEDEELRKMIRRYSKLKSRDHFQAGDSFGVDQGLDQLARALRWPEKDSPRSKA